MSVLHAHNLALLACLNEWRAHLQGDAPEPETKIWKALRPGHNPDNEACATLDELIEIAVRYGVGKIPLVPILIYVSRSTMTLIERLDGLHHTPHIDAMDATAKEVFAFLVNGRCGKMSAETFATELHRMKDEFVKACAANANELHGYILKCREKDSPSAADVVERAQVKLSKVVTDEAKKTRRTVTATANRAIREIRTSAQSEYDKRGPSSAARGYQLRAVIDRLTQYRSDSSKLPTVLRGRHPSKWMHQACRDTWVEKAGGYPSMNSLYLYCHRNEERILSLAGL